MHEPRADGLAVVPDGRRGVQRCRSRVRQKFLSRSLFVELQQVRASVTRSTWNGVVCSSNWPRAAPWADHGHRRRTAADACPAARTNRGGEVDGGVATSVPARCGARKGAAEPWPVAATRFSHFLRDGCRFAGVAGGRPADPGERLPAISGRCRSPLDEVEVPRAPRPDHGPSG